ncbi:MAG: endosialidase [Lachnospiraceae bacterium]|nr:endosialidase [Lachnospiraceae bacterium]
MAVVQELLKKEENGTLSFGNYELDTKSKLQDFEYEGDLYKVKTFKEITKLEKNGMFVYESVPGTAVFNFVANDKKVSFDVEGKDDSQITLELEPEKEYKVFVDNTNIGKMKTNLGGKLVLSVELNHEDPSNIVIEKL